MVTHDDVIDKTKIYVSPDKVRAKMHTSDLTVTDMAQVFHLSVPAVSRGLKSPSWLSDNLSTLAKTLHVAKRELLAQEDDVQHGPVMLTRICGASREGGYVLPTNCEIRRVTMGGASAWYLCAGRATAPQVGDLVVVSDENGGNQLYRFTHDEDDRSTVILLPVDRQASGVRVLRKRDRVSHVRIAICPVKIDGGAK